MCYIPFLVTLYSFPYSYNRRGFGEIARRQYKKFSSRVLRQGDALGRRLRRMQKLPQRILVEILFWLSVVAFSFNKLENSTKLYSTSNIKILLRLYGKHKPLIMNSYLGMTDCLVLGNTSESKRKQTSRNLKKSHQQNLIYSGKISWLDFIFFFRSNIKQETAGLIITNPLLQQ